MQTSWMTRKGGIVVYRSELARHFIVARGVKNGNAQLSVLVDVRMEERTDKAELRGGHGIVFWHLELSLDRKQPVSVTQTNLYSLRGEENLPSNTPHSTNWSGSRPPAPRSTRTSFRPLAIAKHQPHDEQDTVDTPKRA